MLIKRVLAKEILRRAFSALSLFVPGGGESVHGEFGRAQDWNQAPPQPPTGSPPGTTTAQLVSAWIQQNANEVARVTDVLLVYSAPALQARRQTLIDYCLQQLVPLVTQCSTNPRFPQDSLNERLANAGVLPMFGFPTRTRYLFHHWPTRAYPWPPDDVVDRDLDIAISQFAPGAETVKDGLIHTSIGVVDYRPLGNRPTEFPGPLGPQIAIGVCAACQAIDESQPPAASCPVCGATPQQDPGYRATALSQPAGFRTWYGRSRDFDGTFEWTPRASRPKMGVAQLPLVQRANFEVWADQETVYVINDNDGRLFDFEKLAQGETWVTRLALADVGVPNPQIDPGAGVDQRALGSVKTTDVMVLGIVNWPAGIRKSPTGDEGLGVRSALYSFGFLARRAAADRLDVDEREIRVGLRVLRDAVGDVVGQIFISDSLENGAGYASLLGQPLEAEALLQYMIGQSSPVQSSPVQCSMASSSAKRTRVQDQMRARLHVLIACATSAICPITAFSIGALGLIWLGWPSIPLRQSTSQYPTGREWTLPLRDHTSLRCRGGNRSRSRASRLAVGGTALKSSPIRSGIQIPTPSDRS
jgi:DEAD/DEAH box helicase domain-containing protein